jgi:hypothetical protein
MSGKFWAQAACRAVSLAVLLAAPVLAIKAAVAAALSDLAGGGRAGAVGTAAFWRFLAGVGAASLAADTARKLLGGKGD